MARLAPATTRPGPATTPSRRAAARACRRRPDDGVTTLEFVLVTPVLIFLIFVVIQFALWYVARHVVLAAAQEGGRASRDAGQTTAQAEANGQRAALSYVRQIGPGALQGPPGAAVTIAGDVASVTVTGTAARVIPGLTLTIRETSTGAIEKFRGP